MAPAESAESERPPEPARRPGRRWRYLIAAVLLGIGVASLVALYQLRPVPLPLATEEKAWPLQVVPVRLETLAPSLTLFGRVDSPRLASLSSAVTAYVEQVRVAEGQVVSRAELLVQLDDRDVSLVWQQRDAEVADIRAQIAAEEERHRNDQRSLAHEQLLLALTRSAVQRAQDLARRNLGSRSQLDSSRLAEARQLLALESRQSSIRGYASRRAQLSARLARAEAQRSEAALDVERTRVVAPFRGRVTQVSVSPGDRVRAGDPLISLFDLARMEIRAQIPTRHLQEVESSLGQGRALSAQAQVDGRELEARLERLGARTRAGRGGIDGLFRLEGDLAWLALGRTIELTLRLPAVSGAIALPLEAIYGTNRVFKVEDGRMVGVRVVRLGERKGPQRRNQALVRSANLAGGDRVVVTQLPNALDGLRVRIVP